MMVAALAQLEANAPAIARTLRVFANEHRIRILCLLAAGQKELSFAGLAEGIHISQSALSQHLKNYEGRAAIARPSAGLIAKTPAMRPGFS